MSRKKKIEEEPEAEEDAMPETWEKLPLQEWVKEGFKARVKKSRGIDYLMLRKGNTDHSLGASDPSKISLLFKMFPELEEDFQQDKDASQEDASQEEKPPKIMFKVNVAKPKSIGGSLDISLQTWGWYEWAVGKGYSGSLAEFINDTVYSYFHEHGLTPAIKIQI